MAESHGKADHASGATAHTEAEGGHARTFPPFEKSTFASQLVSLLIAFVALYLIVSRIALPKVGGTINARQDAIDGDLSEAQRLRDESDKALKAYEAELAASRAKAQAISTEARDKFAAAADQERKALEEKLSGKLADAEKTIAATRQSAMSNVSSIANDAASAIVQRLTGVAADAKAVASAVDASLKG